MRVRARPAVLQEAKPAVVEKTEFKVKLEAFDAANKVALIRAVKDIVKDLNLIAVRLRWEMRMRGERWTDERGSLTYDIDVGGQRQFGMCAG